MIIGIILINEGSFSAKTRQRNGSLNNGLWIGMWISALKFDSVLVRFVTKFWGLISKVILNEVGSNRDLKDQSRINT